PTNSATIPVTAVFTETVSGFLATDLVVTNGAIANFTGSGDTYTFDLIAAAQGTVTVIVPAAIAADGAGNGNGASNTLSRVYDSLRPSATLASATPSLFNSAAIAVTLQFNEPVTGFSAAGPAVTNGTVQNLS